ncbi:MAG: hypothetical protein M3N98_12800 [Actinomycetota bacterium]|nr:hypothetical protein [Actinomycetota bacterium]
MEPAVQVSEVLGGADSYLRPRRRGETGAGSARDRGAELALAEQGPASGAAA